MEPLPPKPTKPNKQIHHVTMHMPESLRMEINALAGQFGHTPEQRNMNPFYLRVLEAGVKAIRKKLRDRKTGV